MFKIRYSDKIEDLAAALKDDLLATREGLDPFEFLQVVVPNGNVAKWLQLRVFATEPKLCAGLEFPFMERRLTELLEESLPPARRTRFELLPDHAYANAILSILLGDDRPDFAPFRRYLLKDGVADQAVSVDRQREARMAGQLADKLADLMDSYEVHRPEIIDAWFGRATDPHNPVYRPHSGSAEAAEAALARTLWGEGGFFPDSGDRLSLRQLFDQVKAGNPKGTARKIWFFGQSAFSLLQVRILMWLARTHEVVVFHVNPCREYWGDITTAREDRKAAFGVDLRGSDPELDYACENPLLKSWGVAGRETLRLFVDAEEANGNETDPDQRIAFVWEPVGDTAEEARTTLEKVRQSVRQRTSAVARGLQDASIQIIGTPGIRREVEMVYNAILGSVCKPRGVTGMRPWPDCTFSDIAVLVPDMATYRPVIEAVFEARHQVPYGLIDTTAGDDSACLRGFLSLIELGRNGLNRERLFSVLENPCVQRALGFSREDVLAWRKVTEQIGAFEGFEHDSAKGYFDWSWALKRMRLATVTNAVAPDGVDLPLVPDAFDPTLKYSEVVELLYRDLRETLFTETGEVRRLPCLAAVGAEGHRGDCWAERLARLVDTYLALDKDDVLEGKVRQAMLSALYALRDVPGTQTFELPVAMIELRTGALSCNQGTFLTSGVTIADLKSISPVPFKQVYVLGLGAGGFPGQTSASTLDLRGTGWRLGDVSLPNMNRFLFLETIMAVRDRLVMSYPNRDIEKDAELFPSGIVRELEAFLSTRVLDRPFEEFTDYPLLERGEPGKKNPTAVIVWNPADPQAGLLPTYSAVARKLARARLAGTDYRPFAGEGVIRPPEDRVEISVTELAAFIRDPFRAVMRHRYGIEVAGYVDTALDPDSPLGTLEGPDQWNLEALWLDPAGQAAVERQILTLTRSGRLPTGILGELATTQIMETQDKVEQVRKFVSDFGLFNGNENTLHLNRPARIIVDGVARKVRFVAEIPNWTKDAQGRVSVLVTGKLEDKFPKRKKVDAAPPQPQLQALPSPRCLEAFLAYLMIVGWTEAHERRDLRIGVVDINQGYSGVWRWSVDTATARRYLECLVRDYWTYGSPDETGRMTDVVFKKVATDKNLPETFNQDRSKLPEDWENLLEKVTARDEYASKSAFNNDLVLEQNLEALRRPPTVEEFKRIFQDRYLLPLSGVRERVLGGVR